MASITGSNTSIFINNGDLRMTQNLYASGLVLADDIIINQANPLASSRISIGALAGSTNQDDDTIAIGINAGHDYQQQYSLAIGAYAGENTQNTCSIAIGYQTGQNAQGEYSIAVGSGAGADDQGTNSIAIGRCAGETEQGPFSIAIGYHAGQNYQMANTIVIGQVTDTTHEDALYVNPIRSDTSLSNLLCYNQETNEVFQNPNLFTTVDGSLQVSNLLTHGITYNSDIIISQSPSTDVSSRISIGSVVGTITPNNNTIAIGLNAGGAAQHSNTIIINANGNVPLMSQYDGSTYMYPFRKASSGTYNILSYDTTTSELVQTQSIVARNGNMGIGNLYPAYALTVGPPDGPASVSIDTGTNSILFSKYVNLKGTGLNVNNIQAGSGPSGVLVWDPISGNVMVSNNIYGTVTTFERVGISNTSPAGLLSVGNNFVVGVTGNVTCTTLNRGTPKLVTDTYVLTDTDSWIIADIGTVTSATVTLPEPTKWPGRELMIKRYDCTNVTKKHLYSVSNNVVRMEDLAPNTPQNVILDATHNGSTNMPYTLWCTLVSDGSNWIQMSGL